MGLPTAWAAIHLVSTTALRASAAAGPPLDVPARWHRCGPEFLPSGLTLQAASVFAAPLVAPVPVRDLLLRAKYLFVAVRTVWHGLSPREASVCCRTYCLFCSRSRAAYSREASKAASDNLSTKCSGLLLPSSLPIWAARVRHLSSAASTAAFSVASKPSNSSDILLADIFRAAPTAVGRLFRAPGSKVPGLWEP